MASNAGSMFSRLIKDKEQRDMLLQIARFGVSGVLLTAMVGVLYTFGVYSLHLIPTLSTTISIALVTIPGYLIHSKFSFSGHGSRDNTHVRAMRFAVTNGLSFASNFFFTWLLTSYFGEPKWTPNLAFLFITPIITFTLNRKWVFA
jgi:putative flippase GtrA